MEEVRRKLERQVAADPSDERAAARLELMQIKSGLIPPSDEGGNMVTTLLRQRVTLESENMRDGRLVGTIVSVYVPTVASRQATINHLSVILGKLRFLVQIDGGKLVDVKACECSLGEK